jgi:hypothetical protein
VRHGIATAELVPPRDDNHAAICERYATVTVKLFPPRDDNNAVIASEAVAKIPLRPHTPT